MSNHEGAATFWTNRPLPPTHTPSGCFTIYEDTERADSSTGMFQLSSYTEVTQLGPSHIKRPALAVRDGNARMVPLAGQTGAAGAVPPTPAKPFKPMQMVLREGGQSTATNGSVRDLASHGLPLGSPHFLLTPQEAFFRRQQGISLNYRGDIHNPHNRGDLVPPEHNTSLFLKGLPPTASVGDLLRAVAALGPTGRVFAASVCPADAARGLVRAAAKLSFFTRSQAETLKGLLDGGALVMGSAETATAYMVRACWNRDRKAPRPCVQADECRVLRIRGPAATVHCTALAAYFDEKFRYELEDVRYVEGEEGEDADGKVGDHVTTEWRFASFQSQAIAAKMALNQERPDVRVTYGRDPCEWGEP